jgi:hypothetical protein
MRANTLVSTVAAAAVGLGNIATAIDVNFDQPGVLLHPADSESGDTLKASRILLTTRSIGQGGSVVDSLRYDDLLHR